MSYRVKLLKWHKIVILGKGKAKEIKNRNEEKEYTRKVEKIELLLKGL